MRKEHRRKIARYVRRNYYRSLWNKFVRVMACVVVFCTTYALILPAITVEQEYLCGMQDHTHDQECYAELTEIQQVCGLAEEPEGHQHNEECWMEFSTELLSCTLPEHTHDHSCKNNPNADLETSENWEATLNHVLLSGKWDKDLIAIAQSQLGYRESAANRDLDTGKGYSRYGAWYGVPYGTWDAMFASFCLHYAGIPQEVIPKAWDSLSWMEKLGDSPLTGDYMAQFPAAGDLLFYTKNQDTQVRTAIVMNVLPEAETTWLTLIEGDFQDQVCQNRVDIADISVLASCHLPSVQNRYEEQKNTQWEIQSEEEPVLPAAQEEENMTWEVFEDTVTEPVPTETQFSPLIPEAIWEVVDDILPTQSQETEADFTVTQMVETENYVVMVEYSSSLVIPEGAQLRATEYPRDSEIFRKRCEEAGYELEWLMNIGFFIGEEEVLLNGDFDVVVTSKQGQSLGQDITHFADDGTERISGEAGQSSVSFSADSFSDFGGGTARAAATVAVTTGRTVAVYNFNTANPASLQTGVDYVIYTGNAGNYTFLGSGLNTISASGTATWSPYNLGGNPWSVSAEIMGTANLADVAWRVEKTGSQCYLVSQKNGQRLTINNGNISLTNSGETLKLNTNGAGTTITDSSNYGLRYNNGWTSATGGWWGGDPTTVYFAQITPTYYPPSVSTGKATINRLKFYNFLGTGEAGGKALAGCVFEVVGDNGKTYTITSGNDSALSLPADIPNGNYTITQISAPEGYIKDLNPIRHFSITNGSFSGTNLIGPFINHEEPDVNAKKTAQVVNYEERIYQVQMESAAKLKTYRLEPIDVRFVVDQSNSMLFPSGLVDTGKKVSLHKDGTTSKINNATNMDRLGLDKDQVYYIMADPSGTATVWAIWHNGTTWMCMDASFYAKADHQNGEGYESGSQKVIFPADRSYADQAAWEKKHKEDTGEDLRSNGGRLDGSLSGSSLYKDLDKESDDEKEYVVYTASDQYNRLHYLEEAMAQVIAELADANPNNHVSITGFTKTVDHGTCLTEAYLGENQVQELLDRINGINTSGGTRQDIALDHMAKQHPASPTTNTYTVLITDGSPDAEASILNQVYSDIGTHANTIKNQGSVMMTVGLGMGANTRGLETLKAIASVDASGEKLYYALDDAANLVATLKRLIFDSMVPDGELPVYGDAIDEISNSFYPVAWTDRGNHAGHQLLAQDNGKDWILLRADDWITLDGKLTSANARDAAGQLLYNQETNTYYVEWKNLTLSQRNGWKGSIFLKAKEDFIGGNAIDTNKFAQFCVHGDGTPAEHYQDIELETPTVNVHLLDMTQQNSEVTVYLGDLVNAEGDAPIDTLKEFFAETDVIKLISDGGNVLNATTADGTRLKDATFTLEYALGRSLTDDEWTRLMQGQEIKVPYTYDDASSHGPVGEFTFRLEKTGINDATVDYGVHTATAACRPNGADCNGAAAETYTLHVRYDAYRLGVNRPNANKNNFGAGPGREVGTGTTLATGIGSVVKANVHKVHVISGSIVITKRFAGDLTSEQDETFSFTIRRAEDGWSETRTITIPKGQSRGSVDITFANLKRDTYTVTEALDAEEVYMLENVTVLNSGNYKTNCYSTPAIGASAQEVTFVMGHNTDNHNVIGKYEETDPYTSYIHPITGVNGAAEFVNKERIYTGEIPVNKAWSDGAENHTEDAVYLVLYAEDGSPVLDENGYARILRLDAANNWRDKFTVVLQDENDSVLNYHYTVREVTAVTTDSNFTAWQKAILENDGETKLYYERAVEQNGIVGVGGSGYIVQYTAWDTGAWTVTNLKSYDLPTTGGVGTHMYTFSGLLVMMAGLMYGYSRRRKRERGASS